MSARSTRPESDFADSGMSGVLSVTQLNWLTWPGNCIGSREATMQFQAASVVAGLGDRLWRRLFRGGGEDPVTEFDREVLEVLIDHCRAAGARQ